MKASCSVVHRSNCDGKITWFSVVGTVLAKRYKILKTVDVDGFKAHDLVLDQTVPLPWSTRLAAVQGLRMFFQKLKSAIQSGKRELRALPAPALAAQENSVFLPDTNDVIRKFNRDTRCVAIGALGAVVFAGLMLALLVQERYPNAVDHTGEAVQAGGNFLLNTNVAKQRRDRRIMLMTRSLKILHTKILPRRRKPPRRLQVAFSRSLLKLISTTYRRTQAPGFRHAGKTLAE